MVGPPTWIASALDVDPGNWTAVGDFQSEVGGSDWTNNDPTTQMVAQGGGIYLYEATGLPPATYYWKAVVTGSWDSISWNERSVNTANMEIVVTDSGETVSMWVDALTGTVKLEIGAAPQWCLGDLDCSGGAPTFLDISYFVAALNGEANWVTYYKANHGDADPPCFWLMGDYSTPKDGVDFLDIVPFANSIGQDCIPYVP